MSTKPNFFKGPALWTLVAGVAIGAGAMYSIFTGHLGSTMAFATDKITPRPASIVKSESLAALKALDSGFATLAEYASPAVVLIKSESKGTPGLTGMGTMVRGGEGSGVILRPDGYIITNDHVVGGFDKVTVILRDGREFPGKVTRAEESDIAVVKIDATNLPTLPFADSNKVRPGQFAMAIGAPYGLENSVTIGHVSAINRENVIPDQLTGVARRYPELIQTDASINMGNSGGPLIDVDGEVIGINSSIISPPGGNGGGIGLGFAISSNQARLLAETLIEKGKVVRSYLGLVPENLKEIQKSQYHVQAGALVTRVESNGPAGMAGVKLNDVVVRIGTVPVTNQIELRNAMLKYAPGSSVDIEVVRDGLHKTMSLKLIEPPKESAQIISPDDSRSFELPPQGNMPDLKEFLKKFGDGSKTPDSPGLRQFGHAKLGVQVHDIDDNARKQFHIPANAKGAVVMMVDPGSIADKTGVKVGDVIQAIGQKDVASAKEVAAAMEGVNWGDQQRLVYVRFGENSVAKHELDVKF